jgi:uncharacterized membrane-anchored protein
MTVRPQRASRALDVTHAYWFAMLAASALGTNLGDLWAGILFPGLLTSLAAMLLVCGAAVAFDRSVGSRSEAGYWVAIVAMRAAATNLADFMTHDMALGYVTVSIVLAGLTLIAARFTHPDMARGGSPRVDAAYWIAMFIAGLFGTVAGDLIHHTIGLYAATTVLCLALAGLIRLRGALAPLSVVLYWAIIMAERCAGTAVGDMLASGRAVGLGLPAASVCTIALILASLWLRARLERRPAQPT